MDLNVWDKCNNRCLMCTNPDWPWPAWDGSFDYSRKAIIKRLETLEEKIKSDDSIYLTGGEPTLHPYFLDIFKYVSRHFPKQRIKLLTNGRLFFYKDFTKKFLKLNDNFDICISFHGFEKEIHEKITRTGGSFAQAFGGLKNLLIYKKPGQIVEIRFVITRLSYKHIKQFLEMAKAEFPLIDRIALIFWEVEGQAVKNLKSIKISYTQIRPYIDEIYSRLREFKEIRFYHFPLCVISEKLWSYVWRTLGTEDIDFIKICGRCNYKKYCLGIPQGYLKYLGEKDFSLPAKHLKIGETKNIYQPINKVKA